MTGPRKLEAHQEAHLAKLEAHHDAIIKAKKDMRREIERQYQERLSEMFRIESLMMNQALKIYDSHGRPIPKAAIHRAVRQGNWNTLQEMYALAADDASLTTVESPEIPLKTYPYTDFEFRTVPALMDRPVSAQLTRFRSLKKLDVALYFRDVEGAPRQPEPDSRFYPLNPHPVGWLEIEGDILDWRGAVWGVEGNVPGSDVQPNRDAVRTWNELVDSVAEALGQPAEIARLNRAPETIDWDKDGKYRVNMRSQKFAEYLAHQPATE